MTTFFNHFDQLLQQPVHQHGALIANSAIAPELIEYDRTRQWVALTEGLIKHVSQAATAPPDLMEILLSSRDKYNDALTVGQQKINSLILEGTQIDDLDRSVLSELGTETKADLQPLLTAALPTAVSVPTAPQPTSQPTAPKSPPAQ